MVAHVHQRLVALHTDPLGLRLGPLIIVRDHAAVARGVVHCRIQLNQGIAEHFALIFSGWERFPTLACFIKENN